MTPWPYRRGVDLKLHQEHKAPPRSLVGQRREVQGQAVVETHPGDSQHLHETVAASRVPYKKIKLD